MTSKRKLQANLCQKIYLRLSGVSSEGCELWMCRSIPTINRTIVPTPYTCFYSLRMFSVLVFLLVIETCRPYYNNNGHISLQAATHSNNSNFPIPTFELYYTTIVSSHSFPNLHPANQFFSTKDRHLAGQLLVHIINNCPCFFIH